MSNGERIDITDRALKLAGNIEIRTDVFRRDEPACLCTDWSTNSHGMGCPIRQHRIDRELAASYLRNTAPDVTAVLRQLVAEVVGLRDDLDHVAPASERDHLSRASRRMVETVMSDREALRAEVKRLNTEVERLTGSIKDWQDGTKIIQECLVQAEKADPCDVPFPLVGDEARLWHCAQFNAYRHALEMMGEPATELAKEGIS